MKRLLIYMMALAVLMAALPLVLYKSGFFVVNRPVKSNILIVEGWMSSHAIDHPPFDYNDFDTIFVVGVKKRDRWNVVEETRQQKPESKPRDHIKLITNGYLFLRGYEEKNISDSISTVRIVANGSAVNGEFAHFFVSVKDSMFGHTFVHEKPDTFTFHIKLPSNRIADLNLYFNNDRLTPSEDINLRVYSVLLDTFTFRPSGNECFYLRKNLTSSALKNANYLASKPGIHAKIIAIDTLFRSLNNTFASAKAFGKYIRKNNIRLSTVNIYTHPNHSRRTRLAYKKALPEGFSVGTYISTQKMERFHNSGQLHWYLAVWDEFISWVGTVFTSPSRN